MDCGVQREKDVSSRLHRWRERGSHTGLLEQRIEWELKVLIKLYKAFDALESQGEPGRQALWW